MIDIFTLAARFDRTVDFSMCRSQFACSTWSQLQGQTELQSVVPVTRTPVSYLTDIRAPFWSECCRFTVHAPLNLQPCRTNAISCQQATIQERQTGSKAESTTLLDDEALQLCGTYRSPCQCDQFFGASSDSHVYLQRKSVSILRLHGLAITTYWAWPYCCFIVFSVRKFHL